MRGARYASAHVLYHQMNGKCPQVQAAAAEGVAIPSCCGVDDSESVAPPHPLQANGAAHVHTDSGAENNEPVS